MSILGDRIRALRKEKNLTQEELAELLNKRFHSNIDRVMISKWERGTQTPVIGTLKFIAEYFGVSLDSLNGYDLSSPDVVEDVVTFDIIEEVAAGEVAAGYNHFAGEEWESDKIEIPSSYLRGRSRDDYFVLRVTGDSMYPLYMEGDILLVLKQPVMDRSGQIGVVLYNSEYGTLKKVEYTENWMRLIPINPLYKPVEIAGSDLERCRILGVPKLLIRRE